jgi:hypothetical protein
MKRMKRILLSLAMIFGLALGGAAIASPAMAAPTIYVCNASNSDDAILAYNSSTNPEKSYYILPGGCSNVDDYSGDARVDVDPAGGAADIDSWEKKVTGESWSGVPCYSGENGASNPYSAPGPNSTTYHTSKYQYCE